jgi:dihydrofolate synthase/folylpolyglutamate synthase
MFKDIYEAVHWIQTQIKFKPKTDLKRMSSALNALDISFDGVKLIHVAGTNGKGSVCAYLTHMFLEMGLSVGTYTSPYLITFNERVRINDQNISDDDLLDEINFIYDFNQEFTNSFGENLAFFELITLIALNYYKKQNVDVIIMEVGLGGLLDATNVLNYDLSLITNIGFDHMKQLGNTLESIASNKLGILKPGNHLITTVDPKLHHYFKDYIKDLNVTSKFMTTADYELISLRPLKFKYQDEVIELSLLGKHQILNAILALEGLLYLYPTTDKEIIKKALKKAIWAGRLEILEEQVYIDGAHNEHALLALRDTLKDTFKDYKIHVLFSALGDKDIKAMLEVIKGFADSITLTSFDDFRFIDLDDYETVNMRYIKGFDHAYQSLKENLKADEMILITGSLHFVGFVKSKFSKK